MANSRLPLRFETVYTVEDYWDVPVLGYANFHDVPHQYLRLFSVVLDDYTDHFRLRRVDGEIMRLATLRWKIWCRWRSAYDANQASLESHPALPPDRKEHERLSKELTSRMGALPESNLYAVAQFRSSGSSEGIPKFEVSWNPVLEPDLPVGIVIPNN